MTSKKQNTANPTKATRVVSEREWQNHVQKLATSLGWKYYHAPDNKPINGRIQKVVAGFPDLVLVRNGVIIFAELKRDSGKLSPEQKDWLTALSDCGIPVYVWRPSEINEVIAVLSATTK